MKILLFLLIIFAGSACNQNAQKSQNKPLELLSISSEELISKMNANDAIVLLDVRTPQEVSEGYIAGTDLFIDFNGGDFEKSLSVLDTQKTYVVYCRSGSRSAAAGNIMLSKEFTNVYSLKGGIMDWSGEIIRK